MAETCWGGKCIFREMFGSKPHTCRKPARRTIVNRVYLGVEGLEELVLLDAVPGMGEEVFGNIVLINVVEQYAPDFIQNDLKVKTAGQQKTLPTENTGTTPSNQTASNGPVGSNPADNPQGATGQDMKQQGPVTAPSGARQAHAAQSLANNGLVAVLRPNAPPAIIVAATSAHEPKDHFAELRKTALISATAAGQGYTGPSGSTTLSSTSLLSATSLTSIPSSGLATTNLNQGTTAADMVNTLLGGGVTVSNATYQGANNASGLFAGGDGIIGFGSGVLLTTGDTANVAGPNNSPNTFTANGQPGDPALNALVPGLTTSDASVLSFGNHFLGFQRAGILFPRHAKRAAERE